jgi:hypothetical protein
MGPPRRHVRASRRHQPDLTSERRWRARRYYRRRPITQSRPAADPRSLLPVGVFEWAHFGLDYQFINNPAYNRDPGRYRFSPCSFISSIDTPLKPAYRALKIAILGTWFGAGRTTNCARGANVGQINYSARIEIGRECRLSNELNRLSSPKARSLKGHEDQFRRQG